MVSKHSRPVTSRLSICLLLYPPFDRRTLSGVQRTVLKETERTCNKQINNLLVTPHMIAIVDKKAPTQQSILWAKSKRPPKWTTLSTYIHKYIYICVCVCLFYLYFLCKGQVQFFGMSGKYVDLRKQHKSSGISLRYAR